MTDETLGKLHMAFMWGSTDEEACLFAEIHPSSLYDYQKQNPDFSEQKRLFKLNPVMRARRTVFEHLTEPAMARWYLEKRLPSEFGKQVIQLDSSKMTIADLIAQVEVDRNDQKTNRTEDSVSSKPTAEPDNAPHSIAELIAKVENDRSLQVTERV